MTMPSFPASTAVWCPGWCLQRARTLSQHPLVLITLLSCHHPWSAQGASGTPGLLPSTLLLVGAAKRTWTMTQRRIPWCLPSVSGRAEEMAPNTPLDSMAQPRGSVDESQVAMTAHPL